MEILGFQYSKWNWSTLQEGLDVYGRNDQLTLCS